MHSLTLIVVLAAYHLAPASDGTATARSDHALVTTSLRLYNATAVEPVPPLSDDDLQQLLGGEVVRLFQPAVAGAPGKATGLIVSQQPVTRLWLALRSLDDKPSSDVVEQRLALRGDDELWFGNLKLPLFFGSRFWLIEVGDNRTLAQATGNRCWEHYWRLMPDGERLAREAVALGKVPGLQPDDLKDAIYLPANRGSWVLVQLDDRRTLLGYQVVTIVGGVIPDSLLARYALWRMGDLLRLTEKKAAAIDARYTERAPVILGGDGKELPRFSRASTTRP